MKAIRVFQIISICFCVLLIVAQAAFAGEKSCPFYPKKTPQNYDYKIIRNDVSEKTTANLADYVLHIYAKGYKAELARIHMPLMCSMGISVCTIGGVEFFSASEDLSEEGLGTAQFLIFPNMPAHLHYVDWSESKDIEILTQRIDFSKLFVPIVWVRKCAED